MLNTDKRSCLALLLLLAIAQPARADVWGVKTLGGSSAPPATLFHFPETLGGGVTVVGAIAVGGTTIDVDGLAMDLSGDLFGFEALPGPAARLLSIDPVTAAATVIGPVLAGREIRGATFDDSGRLWVLDTLSDELAEVDPGTGMLLGTPVALTLDGAPFDLCCIGSDLTQRPDGCLVLVELNKFFTVSPSVGALTLVEEDTVPDDGLSVFLIGVATSRSAPDPTTLFTYEVNAFDDIMVYEPSTGYTRTEAYPNIISGYNAGRGDLAALPPASVGPLTYCTAGTSASGCTALISASGTPSASASSGFTLSAASVESAKDGLFFFGVGGRQANSWGNGTSFQCVVPPVKRAGLLVGTGVPGACTGSFAQDLNARWCPTCPKPAQNPGAGAAVQAQLWYRDPFNTSNQTTSLSNAIEFCVAP